MRPGEAEGERGAAPAPAPGPSGAGLDGAELLVGARGPSGAEEAERDWSLALTSDGGNQRLLELVMAGNRNSDGWKLELGPGQ